MRLSTHRLRQLLHSALPIICFAAFATTVQAAPTIDLSGLTDVMRSLQTAALLVGAILALISLVFAIFQFVGGNIFRGVTGVFGVLLGAGIIGWGPAWIASLTGQNVGN
jgi:hypothetical protein